jgi:hypothetical protein
MARTRIVRISAVVALWLSAALAALCARADTPGPDQIIEYYNTVVGRYHITGFFDEFFALDHGLEGPGWHETGVSFGAYVAVEDSRDPATGKACDTDASRCMPVSRFYSPRFNSHFFTADPAEVALLERPGSDWQFEEIAFFIPVPHAGQCAGTLQPVYRVYNNRAQFGDASHRFTPSAGLRQSMIDQGWVDEGIAFCAYPIPALAQLFPMAQFLYQPPFPDPHQASAITTPGGCANPGQDVYSCIEVDNLPLPTPVTPPLPPDPFAARTGLTDASVLALPAATPAQEAKDEFVQIGDPIATGIHVTTQSRGPRLYSSITPVAQLNGQFVPNGFDGRFFPWRPLNGTAYELVFASTVGLRNLTSVPGGSAYGHSIIEFVDVVSGGRFRFNAFAFGTTPVQAFTAHDAKDGVIIVGAPSPDSAYSTGDTSAYPLVTSGTGLDATGHPFTFRISRAQFTAILAQARTLAPSMSDDPDDYWVDRFGFHAEVMRDGEIGMRIEGMMLSQLAPP